MGEGAGVLEYSKRGELSVLNSKISPVSAPPLQGEWRNLK